MSKAEKRRAAAVLLCVACVAWPADVGRAHEDPGIAGAQLAVTIWAQGLVSRDVDAVASVLHDDFRASGGLKKARYLRSAVQSGTPTTRVLLGQARYERTARGYRVGPVVIRVSRGLRRFAAGLELVEVEGAWRILTLSVQRELPAETPDAITEGAREIGLRIRDAQTGEPIAARIHVEDSEGRSYAPPGHPQRAATGWGQDLGGDVVIGGKPWAYVRPDLVLWLPEGSYQIEVTRGVEYRPVLHRFAVPLRDRTEIEVRLERWVHMSRDGWYSGDTHVHFMDPEAAMLELEGEDLHVVNVLATRWRGFSSNVSHFSGRPSRVSRAGRIVYVSEEARHGFLGHAILLGLRDLVHPMSWGAPGGRSEGVVGSHDYPPLAHHADRTHDQGGLVSWAHLPMPMGELAVDAALGKLDSVDLMTFGDAFAEDAEAPGPARTWYRLLNSGVRLAATAGTDKMFNTQVVGAFRTYARVSGDFSYSGWLDAIRAGRSFATSGPMLELTANGRGLGESLALESGAEVDVRIGVRSRVPLEWLELIRGGEVVQRWDDLRATEQRDFSAVLRFDRSTWIAARARGVGRVVTQQAPHQAHTSPIYLEVDGRPTESAEDAEVLAGWVDRAIRWAREDARFETPTQRDEVIALFRRARAVYRSETSAR